MSKPVLGRGLGVLLGGAPPASKSGAAASAPKPEGAASSGAEARERVLRVPLSRIRPSPYQPRKDFSEEALQELADSIRAQGIVQPLVVRLQGGDYELIAGERRWRAAQRLGLSEVPVIVREADDHAALELALIENLQRENLNAMEEALGYAQLIGQFKLKQEEVAMKVGKSRAAVANALRLLKLPEEVQGYVRNGQCSVGHAKVILGLGGEEEQTLAARQILQKGLNVRQTEELVSHWQQRQPASPKTAGKKASEAGERDPHLTDLEGKIQEKFGTKVHLRYRQGKGAVEILFFNDDDLQRVLELMGVSAD